MSDFLTRTRAALVTSSAGADSSDRSMQASNLYSHAWRHIHWLKLDTKARGYCEMQHTVTTQKLKRLQKMKIIYQKRNLHWRKKTLPVREGMH